jgi:hypothetical protein
LPLNTPTGPTIFQPTIYTSSAPLLELDFNLHKSNSTYLSDLDIARGHHIYSLFRLGFTKYSSKNPPTTSIPTQDPNPITKTKPGPFYPALGGVTCTFKREIKPYHQYEIWTRVVSWDSKWLYLISHFVEKGAGNPTAYSDQPWRKQKPGKASRAEKGETDEKEKSGSKTVKQPKIYAFSMSKYAFKQGRITVPPSAFLEACELLPKSPLDEGKSDEASGLRAAIEAKRKEGLGLSGNMAGLEEGLGVFKEEKIVFASY